MKVARALTLEQHTCYQLGLQAVRSFENEERNLVENLIEAESLGLPKAFELPSLFRYAVDILGLTESVTGMMINVARKSKRVPMLRAAIQNKQVTVSKAHKFCAAVNEVNVEDWILFASSHTAREIEDRMRQQDPSRAKTHKFILSLHAEQLLKRVQSLESQRQSRHVSKEEALELAMEFYVDRKDPVRRADRVTLKASAKSEASTEASMEAKVKAKVKVKTSVTTQAQTQLKNKTATLSPSQQFTGRTCRLKSEKPKPLRTPITAEQRNAVLARTRGCCTYMTARGERCGEDKWIDIHHITPVKDGGTNEIENLTVLCGFHHDLIHQLELPFESDAKPMHGHFAKQALHS